MAKSKKIKSQAEITSGLEKIKKESDTAGRKAEELATLAENTKALFESLQGEASAEAAASMETAAEAVQGAVEAKSEQTEQQIESLDAELDSQTKELDESSQVNQKDISQLNQFKSELKGKGVDNEGISQAVQAKTTEVDFLSRESENAKDSQKEIKRQLDELKKKRQAAKFNYKSKGTLG